MRRAMLAMVIILLIASISACGGNQDTTAEVDIAFIANPDRSLFYGETLTIATADGGADPSPYQTPARQYMDENPGVTIEVISLRTYVNDVNRFANKQNEVGVQLMAGSAPVLIDGRFVDHRDPRSAHFFADWLPIMDATPSFDENDWFMNVFHASAVNGQLLAFPMSFSYEMVAANSTVPGLSEALAAQDSITLSELIELHRRISADTTFLFNPDFNANRIVALYLDSFLDIETGLVDFDNKQFIDLITYAREITSPDFRMQRGPRGWIDPELEAYWSKKYFFSFADMYQLFPRFEVGPLFTELTPLVNERSELLVAPRSTYVLNANATPIEQALAWDFIQFVMNSDNQGGMMSMYSTNKPLFYQTAAWHSRRYVSIAREEFGWQLLTDTIDESAAEVTAQKVVRWDMPMAITRNLPFAIENIIDEALELFHNGLVSAEQTAADLQNRVTLALMEMGISEQ